MSLTTLISGVMALTEVKHLTRNMGTKMVAWGLQALALLSLAIAAWRALGYTFGPLLGPLVAALLLAVAAMLVQARLRWQKRRAGGSSKLPNRQEIKDAVPRVAIPAGLAMALPVVAPLLRPLARTLLQPKRLVLLAAAASVVAGVVGSRRTPAPRP